MLIPAKNLATGLMIRHYTSSGYQWLGQVHSINKDARFGIQCWFLNGVQDFFWLQKEDLVEVVTNPEG